MNTYKPGEKAPDSGELVEIGPRGGKVEGGPAVRLSSVAKGSRQLRRRAICLSINVAPKRLTKTEPLPSSMLR